MKVTVDTAFVSVIIGVVIPYLTALVTKAAARPIVKQVVTVTLAALATVIQALFKDGPEAIITKETAILFVTAWLTAFGSYKAISDNVIKESPITPLTAPTKGIGKAA